MTTKNNADWIAQQEETERLRYEEAECRREEKEAAETSAAPSRPLTAQQMAALTAPVNDLARSVQELLPFVVAIPDSGDPSVEFRRIQAIIRAERLLRERERVAAT